MTDGTIMIPRLSLDPIPPALLRPVGRDRADGSQAAADSDIRPFYGHAISNLDRRTLEANNEVGPFYGHALPSEVFGGWRDRRSIRPFYGHAVSSDGD